MTLKRIFILLLFLTINVFSQNNKRSELYNSIRVFSHDKKDSISFKKVIRKFDIGEFKKDENFKIYKKLESKSWWFHIPVKQNETEDYKYLTVSNPYLYYGKVYLRKNGKLDSLYRTSYSKHFPFKFVFYRHPVWKIPVDGITNTEVFLKLKNDSGRSRLEFHLETENEFLKRIETEYIFFGMFIAFIVSMVIILLYFSVLKKEYSVIFYAIYVALMLIEFLAGKGLGIQYIWNDSTFLIHSSRSFSQTLGTLFIGLFYLYFYKLTREDRIPKLIFKGGVFFIIPFVFLYIYKAFNGGMGKLYLYVWTILKIIALIWFVNHLYLAIKKRIPHYLMIAFILPILVIVITQSINPSVYDSDWLVYGSINLYYVALVAEILIFTYYIFSSVIQSQRKYTALKKVSNELQLNFQNKAFEIQQQERNKLLNNVHDSFGGYLEALRLRLLQKADNTPEKIQEILDGFYKEYRYLLNSLYAPKINSENFIENLVEFFGKINQLSDGIVTHQFSLQNTQLSQDKCVHLYRIISELITNAIKYAEASNIDININQKNSNELLLKVSDNGIGFDKSYINKNSYGLNSIKTRVKEMNGNIEINSEKNKGTTIKISVPKDE